MLISKTLDHTERLLCRRN